MAYDDRHMVFLQVLMQKGILGEKESNDLVVQLFEDHETSQVINEINKQLQTINMMIKFVTCEVTCQSYWVVASTVENKITRFQTEFTKVQLELLRQIFSQIITSANVCVSSTVCLNFCSTLDAKLSKADANDFLGDMVERKWLCIKDGYYYIGPRSIGELMPYFKSTYEDVFNICSLCQQVILHGASCEHCTNVIHLLCLKKYAMVQNEEALRCPECNNLISDVDIPDMSLPSQNNNEETINSNDDPSQKKRRSRRTKE